jgi:hypothetical protein
VIRKAHWQKAEDERLGFFPVPKILMKNVNRHDEQRQQQDAN